MTDDTSEGEETEIEFSEMMEFAAGQVEGEADAFDGDVPKHAGKLIAARATDLLQTLTNFQMNEAREGIEDPDDEKMRGAIEDDAVNILLAIGALTYEYDLDLAEAFAERMAFIKDYKKMEEALQNAETEEEAMEALDEHLPEDAEMPMQGGNGLEPGQNVDAEGYDADNDRDRHIA